MSGTPIPEDPGAVFTNGCFHPDHAEVIRFFEKNLVYAVQIESCLSCEGGCRYCYASAQDPLTAELGGPARHLAAEFGCRVTGIDATPAMVEEATRRTAAAGLEGRVTYRLGNALDLPFRESSFDTVWGQDAWCYVTDKARLIREAARVTRPGGTIAFTDWIQLRDVPDKKLDPLLSFMLFPYMETPEGYQRLLEENGWEVTAADDLSRDFSEQFTMYRTKIQGNSAGNHPAIRRQFLFSG